MEFEVGKTYKSRDGRKVIIYALYPDQVRPIHAGIRHHDGTDVCDMWSVCSYLPNGFIYENDTCGADIISEWTEELDFDWSVIPPWFNYIAMDKDGAWTAFREKPKTHALYWAGGGAELCVPLDYEPKGFVGNWEDSLYRRPCISKN